MAHPLSSIDPSVLLSSPSVDTFVAWASMSSFYYHYMDIHSTSCGLTTFSEMLVVGIVGSVGFMILMGYQSHRLLTPQFPSVPESLLVIVGVAAVARSLRERKSGEWRVASGKW